MKQLTIISLALGFFLWLQAEIMYAFYIFVLEIESPYPSVGDIFWIAGQFLMIVSFYSMMRWTEYYRKSRLRVLNFLVSLGLGLAVLGMVIMPVVTGTKEITLATVVKSSYPIIDVFLFSFVFGSSIALFQTFNWKIWLYIPCGFLLFLIGDIGLSILELNEAYFFRSSNRDIVFNWRSYCGIWMFSSRFTKHRTSHSSSVALSDRNA